MDRCIDRGHHHASDQSPVLVALDRRREQCRRKVDQLVLGPVELQADLTSTRRAVHDEDVQIVEVVLLDQEVDDRAQHGFVAFLGPQLPEQVREPGSGRLDVLPRERHQDRVLVREVLVEGADRHVGLVGDVVGGGCGVTLLVEDASRCVEDPLDGAARPLLTWRFTGREERWWHVWVAANASGEV